MRGTWRCPLVSLLFSLFIWVVTMMLAARLVAHVTLTASLGHPADLYGSLVPVRPALREGGARVDPHAAELLRFFAHCASEPARHVTEADGSMRTTAAQVGGNRAADMTGRSDFAADTTGRECSDTTDCTTFICASEPPVM